MKIRVQRAVALATELVSFSRVFILRGLSIYRIKVGNTPIAFE